ncbi:MAG: HEAT repeat domain-containing protein, partial [Candidatus Riflebacteria bacterium]|nr:HEAT repeat domain-containing protein [Candidatus Riflebacteria bacterium]
MAEQISLEGVQGFFAQPNKAIRKRALAIILNHEMIEAEEALQQYLGNETDPELQMIGRKVLERLADYQKMSDSMPAEHVVPLLKSPVPETRVRALRRLLRKRTPTLATLLQQYCPMETVPEAALLLVSILNNNPHPGNLPLLLGFLESPSARLRLEAFKGLQILINASLLPLFFKGLVDPSQEIKVMTLQMLRQFPRKALLDALDQMLQTDNPEISRLAAKIFSHLQGADLLPIVQKHLQHPDQTTALFLQTFYSHLGGQAAAVHAAPPAPGVP